MIYPYDFIIIRNLLPCVIYFVNRVCCKFVRFLWVIFVSHIILEIINNRFPYVIFFLTNQVSYVK